MNKGELVDILATKADTTKKQATALLDALIDCVTQTVADGEKVTLVGFGSWESREHKARDGRNPQTGEPVKIPARRVPAFSAGKQFKDAVSGS